MKKLNRDDIRLVSELCKTMTMFLLIIAAVRSKTKMDRQDVWWWIQDIGINLILSSLIMILLFYCLIKTVLPFIPFYIFSVVLFLAINLGVYELRCMWDCGY